MSDFTPGPLTVKCASKLSDGGWDWAIRDTHGFIIAECYNVVANNTRRPAEANARLFAAAPDLLEALKDLKNAILTPQHLFENLAASLNKAHVAISKAEGTDNDR